MGKAKDLNKMGVGERMKASEELGAKVATIVNKAMAACNKLLKASGHGVNIKVEFYRLEEKEPQSTEMTNG